MKKLICLMLALLLCVSLMAACAKEPAEDPDKTPEEGNTPDESDKPDEPVEESPWADSLPEADLGDIDIVFAYFEKNGQTKDGCSVDAAETNGDLINDTMYNRNTALEERFNVNLIGNQVSTSGGIANVVNPVLTSGSSEYDVLVGYQYYDIGLAATGLMYNFNNLQKDHLNIENNHQYIEHKFDHSNNNHLNMFYKLLLYIKHIFPF